MILPYLELVRKTVLPFAQITPFEKDNLQAVTLQEAALISPERLHDGQSPFNILGEQIPKSNTIFVYYVPFQMHRLPRWSYAFTLIHELGHALAQVRDPSYHGDHGAFFQLCAYDLGLVQPMGTGRDPMDWKLTTRMAVDSIRSPV